jgi:hypothetical protein
VLNRVGFESPRSHQACNDLESRQSLLLTSSLAVPGSADDGPTGREDRALSTTGMADDAVTAQPLFEDVKWHRHVATDVVEDPNIALAGMQAM